MGCCGSTTLLIAKGPRGKKGTTPADGADGKNAFTDVTADFVMPAEGANVDVKVTDTSWAAVGMVVYISNCGTMEIITVTASTELELQNIEDTASGLYPENVAPATNVLASNTVTPTGRQGAAGSLTGAAGGDLTGTYPNPTLNVLTTKGDVMGYSTSHARLAVGTDGQLIHASSAAATGLAWADIDLTGAATSLSGQLGVAEGGTGAATAIAGFNALSPLTTNGDIIYYSGGTAVRLGAGSNGDVLTLAAGLPSWATPVAANPLLETEAAAGGSPWTVSAMSDTSKMGKIFTVTAAGSITPPNAATFGLKFLFIQNLSGGAAVITILGTDAGANTVYNNTGPTVVDRGVIMLINNGSNWVQALNVT